MHENTRRVYHTSTSDLNVAWVRFIVLYGVSVGRTRLIASHRRDGQSTCRHIRALASPFPTLGTRSIGSLCLTIASLGPMPTQKLTETHPFSLFLFIIISQAYYTTLAPPIYFVKTLVPVYVTHPPVGCSLEIYPCA